MKIVEKNKFKKDKTKNKPLVKPKKEQVLIVAQEIKFARLLAGNEKKTRDRALKSLKKWLLNCFQKGYVFKEDDFLRIWKGLFYAVWMSDKPLVQEELCESIASILDEFPPEQLPAAMLLVKVGLKVLATEWYGIDQHRMDKCLMLVRRYVRGGLRCVRRGARPGAEAWARVMSGADGILSPETPMYARNATSLILHILDFYIEEISKVFQGTIEPTTLTHLLRPLCALVCFGPPTAAAGARRALTALVRQGALGEAYRERVRAWELMGCPEGGPEALELVSDDEQDEETESGEESEGDDPPLDPRAGRVDVSLHRLPVPAAELAQMLADMLPRAKPNAQRRARLCMQRFQQLASATYPLLVSAPLAPPPPPGAGGDGDAAVKALRRVEAEAVAQSDELALRGLSRKLRKRLLAKTRDGLSIVDDVARINTSNGKWQVEESTSPKQRLEKGSGDKKNKKRKAKQQNGDVATKKQKLDTTQKQQNNLQKKVAKKLNIDVEKKTSEKKTEKLPKKQDEKIEKKVKVNGIEKDKNKDKKRKGDMKVKESKPEIRKKSPTLVVSKVKKYQKQVSPKGLKMDLSTPKKVKFVLKNNSMQKPVDYYKSVRQSPSIPFDSNRKPSKTNLKPCLPTPINPFFKKKNKIKIKF